MEADKAAPANGVFRRGRNVETIAQAHRARVLIDGANYFEHLRQCLLKAQRSVFIIGWDIDSRTPLVGPQGDPGDGYPVEFADFLCAITRERPHLLIHILLWDFSVLYSLEREMFPGLVLGWRKPRQIRLCLDDAMPLGSSHHQKIVTVDDAVAFSGGLDLTGYRWDTCEHLFDNPMRCNDDGEQYRPFHDVQIMVDGDAARALARIAHGRWQNATLEHRPLIKSPDAIWPEDTLAHFRDIEIGIALTCPAYDGAEGVDQVERLFIDMIAVAEREIYIENQFLTVTEIADAIAARMRERPDLEVLLVAPHTHDSWIEARTMRPGRIRFAGILAAPDIAPRVRLLYPEVVCGEDTKDIMVHSKIMVVDDRLLRVGSANLNNRSMGADTECDIVIEARSDAERDAVRRIRNTLLGEHVGLGPDELAAAIAEHGSMLAVAETVSQNGRRLGLIDDGEPDENEISETIAAIADPAEPLGVESALRRVFGVGLPYRQVSQGVQVAIGGLLVLLLLVVWAVTPLPEMLGRLDLRAIFDPIAASPFAPLIVISAFVLGSFVVFPITILIALTGGTFGPVEGFMLAAMATVTSALVSFTLGYWAGRPRLREIAGPRINRLIRRLADADTIGISAVRLAPAAPFALINAVAGASRTKTPAFVTGTLVGMLPSLVAMSAIGHQLFITIARPTAWNMGIFIAGMLLWIALNFALKIAVAVLARRRAP